MDPIQVIIIFLFVVGCSGYLYGVVTACVISLKKDPDISKMPEFVSNIVTTVGAILATNLGAILGLPKAYNVNFSPLAFISDPTATNFQIAACFLYILSLLGASIVWGIKRFTTDPKQIVSTIPELTKTFLGVIVGAMAIKLATL